MPVKVSNVGHRYSDGVELFSGVSFELGEREVVALLGPSGSGKTTLLGILGGLIQASQGDVYRFQQGMPMPSPFRIGWILQSVNLLPQRSALENVSVGALARGATWRDARAEAEQTLGVLGLGNRGAARASSLSGGEAQRVGIARACVSQPDLLLADEPTANLDRRSAGDIGRFLSTVFRRSATVVIATHDLELASMADRILTIQVDGSVAEV